MNTKSQYYVMCGIGLVYFTAVNFGILFVFCYITKQQFYALPALVISVVPVVIMAIQPLPRKMYYKVKHKLTAIGKWSTRNWKPQKKWLIRIQSLFLGFLFKNGSGPGLPHLAGLLGLQLTQAQRLVVASSLERTTWIISENSEKVNKTKEHAIRPLHVQLVKQVIIRGENRKTC